MLLPVPTWLMPSEPPPDVEGRVRLILQNLRASAGIRASITPAMAPLAMLFWVYIGSVIRRFDALAARFHAGRLVIRPAKPRTPHKREAAAKPQAPRRFAWLIDFLPHHAAGYASQLRHMLTHDPELIALMAASPQAGRIFRPLCRMLGMHSGPDLPPSLFPPSPPSRRPRVEAPVLPSASQSPVSPAHPPHAAGDEGDAAKLRAWRDAASRARRLGREFPSAPKRAAQKRAAQKRADRERADILPGYILKPA